MSWKCVLLTETNQASLSLRRFASAMPCPVSGMGIHDASTHYRTVPLTISARGTWHMEHDEPPPKTDPRWPERCACGYLFEPENTYQVAPSRLYVRQDTGEQLTLHEAEPGMMWDAPWFLDFNPPWAGPDGRSLVMRLPGNGEWTIDGPSSTGGGWTRTGEPPTITARPSILSHGSSARQGYHGWLDAGILSDDLEGRRYPV